MPVRRAAPVTADLQCPEVPALDGRLVHVHDSEACSICTDPLIQTADWVLECPNIHLRYTHEEWLDQLLSALTPPGSLHTWRFPQ